MYKGFSIYDFCSLIITTGLILSIFMRKIWKDITNRIFLRCLIIGFIAICEHAAFIKILSIPLTGKLLITAIILENLYYIALLLIIVGIYLYMLSSMGLYHLIQTEERNVYKTVFFILLIAPLVFILLGIPNQWIFELSLEEGYKVAFGSKVINILLMLILLMGLCTALINKRFLTKVKLLDCLILYPINILSLVHQVVFEDYSFEMFVITMSFYVISITTQRAETIINPSVNAKTSYSYYRDVESCIATGDKKIHIFVKLINHSQIRKYIGNKYYIQFLRDISLKLSQVLQNFGLQDNIYYLEDSEFAVVLDERGFKYKTKIANQIAELFYNEYKFNNFSLYPDVRTCVVHIPLEVSKFGYLSFFAKAFHRIVPNEKTPIYFGRIADNKEFKIKNHIDTIIKNALNCNGFEIYYQPIYNLKTNEFNSAEALIRLNDPVYGVITPDLFIPIAEVSGDIVNIGEILLRKVFDFISSVSFRNSKLEYIEVNITLAQCMENNFVKNIKAMLDEYKVEPEKIRFEITENMEGYNVEVIESNLKQLNDLGIKFSLDDYGIGYSNIKQVLALPVDTVKLDKSFVQEIADDQMLIVIKDTITMLRNLGKKILVEGIENEATLNFFKTFKCKVDGIEEPVLGCDYVQGYFFSKPLSLYDFIQFLNS